MKSCACCSTVTDAASCPNCGEASWLEVDAPEEKPKAAKKSKADAPKEA